MNQSFNDYPITEFNDIEYNMIPMYDYNPYGAFMNMYDVMPKEESMYYMGMAPNPMGNPIKYPNGIIERIPDPANFNSYNGYVFDPLGPNQNSFPLQYDPLAPIIHYDGIEYMNPSIPIGVYSLPGIPSSGLPIFIESAASAAQAAPSSVIQQEYTRGLLEQRGKHKKDCDTEFGEEKERGDLKKIMKNIRKYNPGLYRAMSMFGISDAMADKIIKRIAILTLKYSE